MRVALERLYSVEVKDGLQGDTRLIFNEYLVERDGRFPFDSSLYQKLKEASLDLREVGRISRAA